MTKCCFYGEQEHNDSAEGFSGQLYQFQVDFHLGKQGQSSLRIKDNHPAFKTQRKLLFCGFQFDGRRRGFFPFCKDQSAMQHQPFCPSSSSTSSNIITLSHLFLLSINHPFSWREAGILSDNDTPRMPSLNIQPCSSSQFYIVQQLQKHRRNFRDPLKRSFLGNTFNTDSLHQKHRA